MTEDQFYNLLHKYIAGSISTDELELLNKELDRNADRMSVFNYLTNSAVKKDSAEILDEKFQKILNNVESKEINDFSSSKIKLYKNISTYIAAALILIIGYFSFQTIFSNPNTSNTYNIATKYGERKEFVLPDGTKVWLNAGSTVRYKLDESQKIRTVKLDGEGFFDVEHNKEFPMVITAKEMEIKVVGTSFNVRAYKDEPLSEASLLSGKIELQIKSDNKIIQQTVMIPGEKIKVLSENQQLLSTNLKYKETESNNTPLNISKTQITLLENNTSPQETAWKENVLIMEGESLKQALPKLERWFGSKLAIQNPVLDTVKITGPFQEQSIEELIQILKLSGLTINYKKDKNNQITLY
ncbi:FecR family protein [Sphingobacterium cavernae]|uniref:FecR family protein n=1 Tax=Sphingobacterium cavernae TaxID=2592657 RepID=UPI00122FBDAF|nr:FecR domain-containing protein [Sphingobacterium cavernae]